MQRGDEARRSSPVKSNTAQETILLKRLYDLFHPHCHMVVSV